MRDALRRPPDRRPIASPALAVLGCEVVGASGAIFTAAGLASWYGTLVRPALAPPNRIFGPVWTILFALMGTGARLMWRALTWPKAAEAGRGLRLFAGQFVLNLAWSAAFFGAQSIVAGLVVIARLWLAIVATVVAFGRVDRRAGALLVPYPAWVSFAGYLNYAFWVLN